MTQNTSQNDSWYFAYGSNMSKQQMLRRTGSVPESVVARLDNYQLAFRKVLIGKDVFAMIVPKADSVVYGVAYRCSPKAMLQLDHFEGVAENCYQRETVQVTAQNGEILNCIVYCGIGFSTEAGFPSSDYWDLIKTGAIEHQIPIAYVKEIQGLAVPLA